jgi:hypothetical protein
MEERLRLPGAHSVAETDQARMPNPWKPIMTKELSLLSRFASSSTEVWHIRILPSFNNTTSDRSRPGKIVKKMIAIPLADGALKRKQLLREAAQNFQCGVFVV